MLTARARTEIQDALVPAASAVITARRTRLARPRPHEFRRLILALASPDSRPRAAKGARGNGAPGGTFELACRRATSLRSLHEKLQRAEKADQPNVTRCAGRSRRGGAGLPGWVAGVSEMLWFYDELRRHGQQTARFQNC